MPPGDALDFLQINIVGSVLNPTLRYTIALTTLASLDYADGLSALIKHCEQTLTPDDMVKFVDYSLRALVKLTPAIGAPKIVSAASIIHDSVNDTIKSRLSKDRFRPDNDNDYNAITERGKSFLNTLGGDKNSIVLAKALEICPELRCVVHTDVYGRFLSNEAMLPLKETELCVYASAVALEIVVLGAAHKRGAIAFGATLEEVKAAENLGKLARTFAK